MNDSLIAVTGGTFWMGENADDKFANDTERPRHQVSVSSFLLARSPVTLGEFRRFRAGHEYGKPDEWPVARVSWEEAVEYCGWLGTGFRLPTEAEWEFAARAGSTTPYPWGATIAPEQANHLYSEQGDRVGPGRRSVPGAYAANAWGFFDMLGNVCEWVQDVWSANYRGASDDGCNRNSVLTSNQRVLRGGAWDYMPRLLRTSWRDSLPKETKRDNVGFRVARST